MYTYLLSFTTTECPKAADKNAPHKYTIQSLTDNFNSSLSYTSEIQLCTCLAAKRNIIKRPQRLGQKSYKHNAILIPQS